MTYMGHGQKELIYISFRNIVYRLSQHTYTQAKLEPTGLLSTNF